MQLIKNPYVLLTLAMLFWAGNFVLSKAVVVEVRPVTLAFGRWALAFLVVLPFAHRHLRRDSLSLRRAWKVLISISLLGITCFNTFIYVGLQTTTAINSLLLQSFFPVVVPVLAFVFFREKLRFTAVVGILVSLLGTLWLVAQGDLDRLRSASYNPGDGWVFAAVVLYAGYALLLRFRPAVHPLSFLAVTFGLGLVMLLPFLVVELTVYPPPLLTTELGLAFLYLAIFPSLVSYLFFNEAVRQIGATTAGLFSHLVPTFGSLMAVFFLGERFHGYHAVGIGLILAGIGLVVGTRRRAEQDSGIKKAAPVRKPQ
jgi:drug/metabolite transporter (DMT)-like permease